jgi:hypothetical protein
MQWTLGSVTLKDNAENGSGRNGGKWDRVREGSFKKLEDIVAMVAY